MSNTNFIAHTTKVLAAWLNDINGVVYNLLGNGTSVPSTKADLRSNLSVSSDAENAALYQPIAGMSAYQTVAGMSSYKTAADLAASSGSSLVGFIQAGTGAVATTEEEIQKREVCVFDYMTPTQIADVKARTLGQDVTASIQAAIDANYGRRLIFPIGSYLISSALSIVAPIWLMGQASGISGSTYGSVITTTTSSINLINIAYSGSAGNQSGAGAISGLMLDGNSKAAIGLNITGANTLKISFHNLVIEKNTNFGVYLSGNHSFSFYDCLFSLNGITSNLATNAGIKIDGANVVHLFRCNTEANYGSGVILSSGYSNRWHGGAIEGNNYHGIYGLSTAANISIEGVDFESNNGTSTASTYDIYISTTANVHWSLGNLKFSGTTTTDNIYVGAPQTYIRNVRGRAGKTVLWSSAAYSGLLEMDIADYIDPLSVIDNTVAPAYVKVIDTQPQGMGITTPAVPSSTVEQVNLLFVPVAIYITAVGTTTNWSIIDGGGRSQAMGAAVNSGFLCILPPGHGIKITYTGVPSWKWYGL